jgi:prevent-host-death family protein
MQECEREIPLRELRNNVSHILAEVERGACFRVTVRGRPVAELRPIEEETGGYWIPWERLERVIREAPLDPDFKKDVDALGGTIDELFRDDTESAG